MPFTEEQAVHALTVLTRLAQREQNVGRWIVDALLRDPARLVGPAIRVAVETGQPMGVHLDRVLRETDLPTEVLVAARASIPPHTTVLGSTDAVITGILLDRGVGAGTPEHAGLAVQHAERLLETGDLARASEVAATAVEAARQHPGLHLLEALRVRSACHTASGEHLAAIRTAQAAVHALAELGIRSPGVVATTWHTLSVRLLNAGRAGPAAAASDSAEIHARLAIDSAAAERGDIGGAYHLLGLVSLGRAQALIDADRPEEALDPAMRAVTIIREHAVQSPDGHGVEHAQAILTAARALAARREAADESDPLVAAARGAVAEALPAAVIELCRDRGRRRDLNGMRVYAAFAVNIFTKIGAKAAAVLVDAFVDLGLSWLDNVGGEPVERVDAAAVVIEAAVAVGRTLDDNERLAFQRALIARGRLYERLADGPDTEAEAASREAVRVARDGPLLARAVAANSLANRLANAGRIEEAARAEADAVRDLAAFYQPDRADQVFVAAAWTRRLFVLTEPGGGPDDDLLGFAVSLLTSYRPHRAADTVLGNLTAIGFEAVMVHVRRGDAEGAARAHRALGALADATGDEGVRRARVLVAFSALCGHLRAGRVDLAVEAHDDVAGVRCGDEQVVQWARCANALINVYVDTNFAAAQELAMRAGPALRSPQYLAALPSLGENDPSGYLAWLDEIVAGHGVIPGADRVTLEALEADYRATVAQRRRDFGEHHEATLATRVKYAQILHWLGRTAEARTELGAAVEASRSQRGPDHEQTRALQERLDALPTESG
ncbi:hypothetical protein [Micromonospora ureilytica]|uniref:Tetratricopeptide (TPR) repeat protein n=1 Tax=Micromonospora ureilytica TaxID=709868 RepID=A0ABS0JEW9_9ACTN|nr:hypothetical protein [Micromonospora ureilytica]MBG6065614.1 tetratricopeptide (TPR) repeat protein [Micromonospora ureilytica]